MYIKTEFLNMTHLLQESYKYVVLFGNIDALINSRDKIASKLRELSNIAQILMITKKSTETLENEKSLKLDNIDNNDNSKIEDILLKIDHYYAAINESIMLIKVNRDTIHGPQLVRFLHKLFNSENFDLISRSMITFERDTAYFRVK